LTHNTPPEAPVFVAYFAVQIFYEFQCAESIVKLANSMVWAWCSSAGDTNAPANKRQQNVKLVWHVYRCERRGK